MPEFDERDAAIVAARVEALNAHEGPRVGDFVHMPDGTLRRFTYDWDDRIQTTDPVFPSRGFYLGNGYVSYSGALDPSIPKDQLTDTGETRPGQVWVFHHDSHQRDYGVDATVDFRGI